MHRLRLAPYKRLWSFLRPYRKQLAIGAATGILVNAVGALAPWVLKLAVDGLSHEITVSALAGYAGFLLVLAAIGGVLRYAMRMVLIGASRHVELDLRNALFASLQRQSASFYHRYRTGDLMARMTSDLDSVRSVLGPGIMYPLDTITIALFALIMMLLISPKLTLTVFVAAPVVSVSVYMLGRVTYRLHTRIQEQFSRLTTAAQENLSGVRVVRAFAQEEHEIRRFDELNSEYVSRNLAMTRVQALFFPALFLMFEIGTAIILLLGGRGILRGQLTLGDFVAFIGYLSMLAWPLIAVGWVANLFERGAASMKRLAEILDHEPEIAPPATPRVPAIVRGEIEFTDVCVQYGPTVVLKNINLLIPAGKTVAVIGRTGSGKTTLVSLIPRILDPSRGRVLVDGIATTEWDVMALRAAIGMVPQDHLLFSDTLAANIRFGHGNATDGDFDAATATSQLSKDVAEFYDGYETVVGERGIALSGGQKGRTALARALLTNPKILILDDALAAVDTQTEEDILNGLKSFARERTTLIISHRVSTVRHADQIVVIDDGLVVERGTHDELIARGGYYAELDRIQRLEAELEQIGTEVPA